MANSGTSRILLYSLTYTALKCATATNKFLLNNLACAWDDKYIFSPILISFHTTTFEHLRQKCLCMQIAKILKVKVKNLMSRLYLKSKFVKFYFYPSILTVFYISYVLYITNFHIILFFSRCATLTTNGICSSQITVGWCAFYCKVYLFPLSPCRNIQWFRQVRQYQKILTRFQLVL